MLFAPFARMLPTARLEVGMEFTTLKLTIGADRVGIITLDRPWVRNAMNTAMMGELRDCFAGFYVDQDSAACLVLTGSGAGFCAGADLKERKGMAEATWRRQHAIVEQMIKAVMECPIPIIAAVNGAAFAGGWRSRWLAISSMRQDRLALRSRKLASVSFRAPPAPRTCRAPWACAAP